MAVPNSIPMRTCLMSIDDIDEIQKHLRELQAIIEDVRYANEAERFISQTERQANDVMCPGDMVESTIPALLYRAFELVGSTDARIERPVQ